MSQSADRKPRTPIDRTVVHLGTGETLRRAAFWPRLGAYAVDVVVGLILWAFFAALLVLVLVLLPPFERLDDAAAGLIFIVGGFFSAVVFYGLFYGLRRTLGQTLFGLRTVRIADGGRPGAWRGMLRMLGGALLVPGIPIIVVGMVTSATSFSVLEPRPYAVVTTRPQAH